LERKEEMRRKLPEEQTKEFYFSEEFNTIFVFSDTILPVGLKFICIP